MKLFKYENYNITVSEEALVIRPFKAIWSRDTSNHKEKALQELGFLYFYCDPRSDYMYISNDAQRLDAIRSDEGLPDNWNPYDDPIMKDAIKIYVDLTNTSASLLLKDTKLAIEELREKLRNIDLDEKDNKGKFRYTLPNITSTIKLIPSLMMDLQKAEEAMNKEIMENTKMRGQGTKKLFEDGF